MDKTLAAMSFLAGVLAVLAWRNQSKPLRENRKTEQRTRESEKRYPHILENLEQAAG